MAVGVEDLLDEGREVGELVRELRLGAVVDAAAAEGELEAERRGAEAVRGGLEVVDVGDGGPVGAGEDEEDGPAVRGGRDVRREEAAKESA